MNRELLKHTLNEVAAGTLSTTEAVEAIAQAMQGGFVDLGHTRLDIDRRRRRGISEAIFCQGKTPDQIVDIASRLDEQNQDVLCTRVAPEAVGEIMGRLKGFSHSPIARMIYKNNEPPRPGHGTVVVVTAGTTDIPVAEEAALCLEIWGDNVERIFDVGVAGLHRLLAVTDRLNNASVIITVAGMEAALTSVVAGLVSAPVVAVPTSVGYGANMNGIAALMGMLNACSGGVATVNIDNGFGAALLASMINHTGLPRS